MAVAARRGPRPWEKRTKFVDAGDLDFPYSTPSRLAGVSSVLKFAVESLGPRFD
jgi:hypothetical protein